jgi:TRAP-type C4-dicarboxylate transport system permease small subunit
MKDNTSTGGISFFGLLTIVFITLKLIGTIDWSWLWVLSPIWIPFALVFLILLIQLTIAAFGSVNDKNKDDDDEEI